jgi:hypothetical protein
LHSFRECTKPESYSNSIKDLLRFSAFTAETHREALFPIVVRGRTFSQLAWLTSTDLNLQAATASLADKISYTKRFRVVQPQPARFFNEVFKKLTNALKSRIFTASDDVCWIHIAPSSNFVPEKFEGTYSRPSSRSALRFKRA